MRVPFSDVDMHGNVHNSRYVVYGENAVNDFLAERGLAERTRPGVGDLIFLVKELSVEYRRPLRFGDTVACRVRDVRVAGPRLTFDVTVLREPEGDGEPAVAAKVTITWVRVSPDRTALRVPPDVADSLRVDA
ncbi:acyl-CoA thioesterase [Marinactinospora thermotolerans]|uniref:Acyl-CoA thioester hydrolase n=1 Tax=Marinactinospora thermotolerans DSM 45154 TaxID=1122192 RepID=A0A1T4ST37_9ACTN|nr:thioesterase family protein [Marinactinospora thermotolerans]SKA31424.1 acyl-CoA thioester hydrolase [Marinactinospora thermotolerans DSM 45154]